MIAEPRSRDPWQASQPDQLTVWSPIEGVIFHYVHLYQPNIGSDIGEGATPSLHGDTAA
jgi:hypothetical protein